MGDRAVVIFGHFQEHPEKWEASEIPNLGPQIYLHWNGSIVEKFLQEAITGGFLRKGDVSYASARFVAYCGMQIPGNLSLGISNTNLIWNDEIDWSSICQGDNGIFIVNVKDWHLYHKKPRFEDLTQDWRDWGALESIS